MFVPCDRKLHVSGHVIDTQHKPVVNATIEFYGVKKQTDEDGCFYFGGLLAAPGFNVAVTKPGYKLYREGKEFDFYDIDVTLASSDSDQPSSAVWHKVPATELSKYKECSEK
jgi:Carboxypeptidase regulatory-like domain